MNLQAYLSNVSDYFSPEVIGEVNDVYVKVAKIKGDKVPWHNHTNEDELFYIISGTLLMEVEGEDSFDMNVGDIYIIKRGINHRVSSTDECQIMLIENKVTAHTGDVVSEITKPIDQQLKSE
ncbi:cupin domain-containing protein [Ancylomarina sp. YFZ004]